MRTPIGLALATCFLAGCSGGALDIGDSDGGVRAAEVSVFSKASVENASEVCSEIRNDITPIFEQLKGLYTSYTQGALRSDLVGGWLACYGGGPPEDLRSFQFTADGHWYTLVDDGYGGLKRGRSTGYTGAPIGYEGTYTFLDDNFNPSGPDGGAVYVATGGVTWFHPEFIEFIGRVMSMTWLTPPEEVTAGWVAIDP